LLLRELTFTWKEEESKKPSFEEFHSEMESLWIFVSYFRGSWLDKGYVSSDSFTSLIALELF
jgi:hypothetical protein